MRFIQAAFLALVAFPLSVPLPAQQATLVDPQASAVLNQAVATMDGTLSIAPLPRVPVPTDSVATGNVTLVEGSTTETGTARILTCNISQTAEYLTMSGGSDSRAVIYSQGFADEVLNATDTSLNLELIVTSQSVDWPLPLLVAVLNSSDLVAKYVGLKTLNGASVHHIQFRNTFASIPAFQFLANFSVKDIWIDATSGLLQRLSYNRRAAGGDEPAIPVDVFYSDWNSVPYNIGTNVGMQYPFMINKSFNGTPRLTITIQSVTFNNGLTDADFPVQH